MFLFGADDEEYTVETREASPAHLLTKINSFSMLSKNEINKIESKEIKSGSYNWKVRINLDHNGHISVYLSLVGTSSLPEGWEVNAIFNFFLYNHKSNNYRCFRGKARRFLAIDSEWGFSKLMSMKSLTQASNGYVFKDNCVFGAEVVEVRRQPLIENVYVHNVANTYKYQWKISEFSKLGSIWRSADISVGGYKWIIIVYPNGSGRTVGHSVSIFLKCVDATSFDDGKKVNASCVFVLKNNLIDQKHYSKKANEWFTCSTPTLGFPDFKAIGEMRDPTNGFVVDDCCTVEIQLSVKAVQEAP